MFDGGGEGLAGRGLGPVQGQSGPRNRIVINMCFGDVQRIVGSGVWLTSVLVMYFPS